MAEPSVTYTSNGKYSLNQLAKSHGLSVHQLVNNSLANTDNGGLASYIAGGNYNNPVPAGVKIYVPQSHWRA